MAGRARAVPVQVTVKGRRKLVRIVRAGTSPPRLVLRAKIVLAAADGQANARLPVTWAAAWRSCGPGGAGSLSAGYRACSISAGPGGRRPTAPATGSPALRGGRRWRPA